MTIKAKNWTAFLMRLKQIHKDYESKLTLTPDPLEQWEIGAKVKYAKEVLSKYSIYLRGDVANDVGKTFLNQLGDDVAAANNALAPATSSYNNAITMKKWAETGTRLQKDKAKYELENATKERRIRKAEYDVRNSIYQEFNRFRRS